MTTDISEDRTSTKLWPVPVSSSQSFFSPFHLHSWLSRPSSSADVGAGHAPPRRTFRFEPAKTGAADPSASGVGRAAPTAGRRRGDVTACRAPGWSERFQTRDTGSVHGPSYKPGSHDAQLHIYGCNRTDQ